MNTPDFSKVQTTQTAAEAEVLLGLLRAAGLHPRDLSFSGHFTFAGAETSFSIMVPTEELAEAREILSSKGDA